MSILFMGKPIGKDTKFIQEEPTKYICMSCKTNQHINCMTNKCECRCKQE